MQPTKPAFTIFRTIVICLSAFVTNDLRHIRADEPEVLRIEVTVDRGQDIGQAFGSLFEMTSRDGSITIGAGFANGYGTRYRSDRHELSFFVRPRDTDRPIHVERLPRPNDLCGTYLFSRDGEVFSTYGGLKRWDESRKSWVETPGPGGTDESMRLGKGVLRFGDSSVTFEGRTILNRPEQGNYQLFFYANGLLCFYHVNRGAGGYRPYTSDADGYSKLYACPWTPEEAKVDLSKAAVMTLPVVGETTFAWGVRGDQIVTGSNIGGFYVFENGQWNKRLEPNLKVSYQLYSSMAFGSRLLMGQYPTGRFSLSTADRSPISEAGRRFQKGFLPRPAKLSRRSSTAGKSSSASGPGVNSGGIGLIPIDGNSNGACSIIRKSRTRSCIPTTLKIVWTPFRISGGNASRASCLAAATCSSRLRPKILASGTKSGLRT